MSKLPNPVSFIAMLAVGFMMLTQRVMLSVVVVCAIIAWILLYHV